METNMFICRPLQICVTQGSAVISWIIFHLYIYSFIFFLIHSFKYIYFYHYTKVFDGVNHDKLWKTLGEMGIPDHLTCLLRNLYAGQGATVRTLYGTTDWFKIEKGVWQGCLLSCCLFNLYAEHIVRKAQLDELQNWIKKVEWDINNIRYVDDTTLMAENEEELKSLLMRVKEESEKLA